MAATIMRNHIPLTFPATRKALWNHTAIGGELTLRLPTINVSITEQVLFLASGQARSGRTENCYMCGNVCVEADCSNVTLAFNQFDSSEPPASGGVLGDVRMPTSLICKPRQEKEVTLHKKNVELLHMFLSERACSGNKVDLSGFITPMATCTLFTGSNQIHADIEVDVISLSCEFNIRPIEPASIATTALSKAVLNPHHHSLVGAKLKSGFLTMDQYRKVVFLLESDPKVVTLPIVGIWVSGIDLITDPYIWACCARYIYSKKISDRVCKPSEPFLLVHKSDIYPQPSFYDCIPDNGNIDYKLLSGRRSYAMEKEVEDRRKGSVTIEISPVEFASTKGKQFCEILSNIEAQSNKKNEMQATPKSLKGQKQIITDDDTPRSNPVPYTSVATQFELSVPDITMLDDSIPKPTKPVRQALRTISNTKLNTSPSKMNSVNSHLIFEKHHSKQLNKSLTGNNVESTARKITFDDVEENHPIGNKVISQILARTSPQQPRVKSTQQQSSAPILYPLHSTNGAKWPTARKSSSTAAVTPNRKVQTDPEIHENYQRPAMSESLRQQYASNYTMVNSQQHLSSQSQPASLVVPAQSNTSNIGGEFYHNQSQCGPSFQDDRAQPCTMVNPCPQQFYQQQAYPPCACQIRAAQQIRHLNPSAFSNSVASVPSQHSQLHATPNHAETVTVTYQHKLSPVQYSHQESPKMQTPSPLSVSTQSSQLTTLTPEVKDILQNQERQLKALQQQIQRLLALQESRQMCNSIETQTTPTRQSMCVNTGVSLLAPHTPNSAVSSDEPESSATPNDTNESSRSHSLIQHDLTGLELPMQVTSRSFSSDLNVDYESYEDSPSSSPKRDNSSDSSWESPILGESVSMIAANQADQQSTKQQLGNIMKNVKEMLARYSPTKTATSQAELNTPNKDELHKAQNSTNAPLETLSVTCNTQNKDVLKKEPEAFDVAEATKTQLTKMGVPWSTPERQLQPAELLTLPQIQYISMMLTDSMTSESDRSMEFNALALKYLKDEQLTELAQFTMSSKKSKGHASMLQQVLTINGADASTYDGKMNMSFATQQYMKRYALTVADESMLSSQASSNTTPKPPRFFDDTPGRNLKSILKWNNQQDPAAQIEEEGSQPMPIQVLDIDKLKELPKLL